LMRMQHTQNRAVTLTEVLTVIIIIGILAALALPQFTATRERALSKEAKANLKLIDAAERIYRMEMGFYYPHYTQTNPESDPAQINSNLRLVLTESNWDYRVESRNSSANFTAYANRDDQAASPYKDCQYEMSDSNTDPVVSSGCEGNCP